MGFLCYICICRCVNNKSWLIFCLQPSPSNWTLLRPTRTWRWRTWAWSGTAVEERYRTSARKRTEPTPRCTPQPGLYECTLAVSYNRDIDYKQGSKKLIKNKVIKNKMVYCLPSVSVIRSALMSPKRAPTARPGRDRFTAESYTVLGKNTHC